MTQNTGSTTAEPRVEVERCPTCGSPDVPWTGWTPPPNVLWRPPDHDDHPDYFCTDPWHQHTHAPKPRDDVEAVREFVRDVWIPSASAYEPQRAAALAALNRVIEWIATAEGANAMVLDRQIDRAEKAEARIATIERERDAAREDTTRRDALEKVLVQLRTAEADLAADEKDIEALTSIEGDLRADLEKTQEHVSILQSCRTHWKRSYIERARTVKKREHRIDELERMKARTWTEYEMADAQWTFTFHIHRDDGEDVLAHELAHAVQRFRWPDDEVHSERHAAIATDLVLALAAPTRDEEGSSDERRAPLPVSTDARGMGARGMTFDDARCLTVWRCRTWGCGNVVTLLRTACNPFGPTRCPNCDPETGAVDFEQLRHENINPGTYPFPSVESLVETFRHPI